MFASSKACHLRYNFCGRCFDRDARSLIKECHVGNLYRQGMRKAFNTVLDDLRVLFPSNSGTPQSFEL
jgi:hypothetical protein